ncbi:Protein of unknown function, partial [Gryllus bimaculatus]
MWNRYWTKSSVAQTGMPHAHCQRMNSPVQKVTYNAVVYALHHLTYAARKLVRSIAPLTWITRTHPPLVDSVSVYLPFVGLRRIGACIMNQPSFVSLVESC